MNDKFDDTIWDFTPDYEPQKEACLSCAVSSTPHDDALKFLRKPDEDRINTYVIVDPTLRKTISGLFDLDVLDAQSQCLFNGRAAEENKEVAPYLVDATVYASDQVPRFNRTFIDDHWGRNTGIIIRSRATFEEVRKHFRRFTKLRHENREGWVFFRFWDPRIASVYFRTIQQSALRAEQWFGRGLIDSFVIEEDNGSKATTFRSNGSFDQSNIPAGSVVLTDWEMRPFQISAYDRDVARMADALKDNFSSEFRNYSTENIEELIRPTLTRFQQLGFRRKENLYVIAAWGMFFGSDFIEKDNDGILAKICASDMPEQTKFKALKSRMAEFGQPKESV